MLAAVGGGHCIFGDRPVEGLMSRGVSQCCVSCVAQLVPDFSLLPPCHSAGRDTVAMTSAGIAPLTPSEVTTLTALVNSMTCDGVPMVPSVRFHTPLVTRSYSPLFTRIPGRCGELCVFRAMYQYM